MRRTASRLPTVVCAIALVALTLAVYAPVRHFDFVQVDDPLYVAENPNVLSGLTTDGIAWAFTTGRAANWHPVTWLSHMLDVQWFGVAPGWHHVTSLLLHALNTLLLFGLLVRLTGARWRSAFVAALFAIHPLHVESVAWIAERKDVLSTLFWMLTTWAYVEFVRASEPPSPLPAGAPTARRTRVVSYVLVLVFFALGLMAKPMLVTLPFVLLLLDIWPLGRLPAGVAPRAAKAGAGARRGKGRTASVAGPAKVAVWPAAWPLVREKLPLFLMAAASSIVTILVQESGGAVTTLEVDPFGLRLQNALVSVVLYLRDAAWPANLALLYPFPASVPAWQVTAAIVVLAAISFLAYRTARTQPYLPVGWLW